MEYVIRTYALGLCKNLIYVHTDLIQIEHNKDNDPNWLAKWNRSINFFLPNVATPSSVGSVNIVSTSDYVGNIT